MSGTERANGHRPTGLLHLLDPALKLAPHPKQEDLSFNLTKALDSIVQLTAEIPENAFSAKTLGKNREGNAIQISNDGLLLTIGYLVVDAHSITIKAYGCDPISAELVAYSHETGIAIIQTSGKLSTDPIELGSAEGLIEGSPVIIAPYGGEHHSISAKVVSRREFAGSWEYMLDNAIFTAPIHPNWSGAALIEDTGKLCGIGSLWVNDAETNATNEHVAIMGKDPNEDKNISPGNMFVPIDVLKPIYDDLVSSGIVSGEQRPWLGMYTTEAMDQLYVSGVIPNAPADLAKVQPGDLIIAINGQEVDRLTDMYRLLWSLGPAGSTITLNLNRNDEEVEITVISDSRYSFIEKRKHH